jgi:hypothetical protein
MTSKSPINLADLLAGKVRVKIEQASGGNADG